MPFSISAGVGFIALFGVAVLNRIVLVAEFNRLKAARAPDNNRSCLGDTSAFAPRPDDRPGRLAGVFAHTPEPWFRCRGAAAAGHCGDWRIVVATFLTLFVLPVLYGGI